MKELITNTDESTRERKIESDDDIMPDYDENVCRNPDCKIARKHCHIATARTSRESK